MSVRYTCALGHQWEPAGTDAPFCPHCGHLAVNADADVADASTHLQQPAPGQTESLSPPGPVDLLLRHGIPGYEILGEVARGGMGIVYRARQRSLNRIVALKVMRRREHTTAQDRARFRVEAEAVARLDHPNIVRIHDFGEHEGLPYFSMEFVEGGSLAHKLAAGPLPPAQAAHLVESLARAMDYAHGHRIIHRDLKPANILLAPAGSGGPDGERPPAEPGANWVPKIADFGLVKCLDEDLKLTITHAVMGTASYMAPEQAGLRRDVGPAVDVYALGAILYEALTGRPPFRAATRELTILQVLCDEPVRPTQLIPGLPADVEGVCLKCLEKDPAQRYPGALALAEDLHRFQGGEPLAIKPLSEWERQARWARRAGYEILEVSGCSVLGLTYRAVQLCLNRVVTLKTISSRSQSDPARREQFRTEAEVAAHMQHPNILQIYDFGEEYGQSYLALEHVEGGTLAERCTGQPWPAREAAEMIEKLARATHHAHRQGIVHTNLRPFNVLLTDTGEPKITDFGLARLLEKGHKDTGQRGTWGSLSNYMAPEQAAGRPEEIGPATDLHALGAMLYEMLTGRPPYLGDTVRATVQMILQTEPTAPTQLVPGLPRRLETVCLRCLRKEPRERYQSAAEMAHDLRRYLGGEMTQTDDFELVPGYELLQELGRGGTGIVYKARQVSLDRVVALKIFREDVKRVLATNRAVGRLQHTNLVQVHDCGERDGVLYVAEELVDGPSLDQKIAGQPQPPAEAAAFVETLARAVHYAHSQGIVHRNLKPSVVLLTALGVPKVSSFDLARLLTQEPEKAEVEGTIPGTPAYMAPEQVSGRVHAIGPATDVHGLGVILYEMLTGQPPFAADNPSLLAQQVLQQEPAPPRQLVPSVPPALEAICLRCLRKEPGERYASAEALADELHGFLAAEREPQQAVVWGLRRHRAHPRVQPEDVG
jgi:serine/threonine protein kinase